MNRRAMTCGFLFYSPRNALRGYVGIVPLAPKNRLKKLTIRNKFCIFVMRRKTNVLGSDAPGSLREPLWLSLVLFIDNLIFLYKPDFNFIIGKKFSN